MEIKYYDKHFDKFKGLMFKKNFDYGVRLRCNGIHTFFMKENINVILTDKNNKVIKIFYDLKPWRIILPINGVYYTYELPTSYKLDIKENETLPNEW